KYKSMIVYSDTPEHARKAASQFFSLVKTTVTADNTEDTDISEIYADRNLSTCVEDVRMKRFLIIGALLVFFSFLTACSTPACDGPRCYQGVCGCGYHVGVSDGYGYYPSTL
ncbi:MAG: hypothetical protein O7D30_12250, partial [Rickettsia endosymbiont of Ixodes persulcatus]|nr:hypothetical protein [Rickettsia endosymbiont of Ixodes persulcatus]